jgi:predicted nucleic acid-binding Zn ribbon protein
MERLLGGSPAAVILKLVIASIIVGVVLSFFGYGPRDIIDGFGRFVRWVSTLGLDAFEKVFQYFLIGAAIVIPVWLLTRVFGLLGDDRNPRR